MSWALVALASTATHTTSQPTWTELLSAKIALIAIATFKLIVLPFLPPLVSSPVLPSDERISQVNELKTRL